MGRWIRGKTRGKHAQTHRADWEGRMALLDYREETELRLLRVFLSSYPVGYSTYYIIYDLGTGGLLYLEDYHGAILR